MTHHSNTIVKARERICWKCGTTFHDAIEACPKDGARLLDLNPDDLSDPLVGKLFDGRFRIVRKLGEGGMGNVYAARQIDFERDVALKILKADFLRDENIKKRFMYEARTISNLRHPHAVRLFDFGQAPPHDFYMVMELLEGESLADRLAYRFLTYREIFEIVPPVCGVLGEAHLADVVHRDLKPENIYLCKVNGNAEFPKLLDFGIAKHLTDETMTKSGTLWGTPAYMSPEQAKGDRVGSAADIYAIGIILYELICGNLPFNASTQMGLAMKHISVPARPLSSIPGLDSVPPELDDLILRTLQKDPAARPGSMDELASELERIKALFSDELLDSIPAEEVDAIALQTWIAEEPLVEEELPRASGQFGALSRPDASAELGIYTGERSAPNTADFQRAETVLGAESMPDVKQRRPWLLVGGVATLMLAFIGGGLYATRVAGGQHVEAAAQAAPAVEPAATAPQVDGASTSGAAGAAASMAASVVFTGRSVAASVRPKNVMIVVDEPESTRPDKKRRTVKRAKTQAEPQVKKALEKTF
ncbi:MAG: serine/threonine-protein kinase [bacterium]